MYNALPHDVTVKNFGKEDNKIDSKYLNKFIFIIIWLSREMFIIFSFKFSSNKNILKLYDSSYKLIIIIN